MTKRQPEMLLRWNVFENLAHEILAPITELIRENMCVDPAMWESATRELDQAMAAATCRGDCFNLGPQSTDMETVKRIWDRFNEIAERKYPGDKRIVNL